MLTNAGFALRDAIDLIFDSPAQGPNLSAMKRSLGDRVTKTAAPEDLIYLLQYITCRENGCGPRLADMLVCRQPPMSKTDREFLEGHNNGNQFDYPGGHQVGDALKKQANAAGVSTTGKIYLGGLAAFPGDPKAWVSDRGDVSRVLTERGWGSQGMVDQAPREQPVKRERQLPKLTKGGAKAELFRRLKAKGVSGDLLKGAS